MTQENPVNTGKTADNNAIQLFDFENNEIRTKFDENGEIWFYANEIAQILGYSRTEIMFRQLETYEKHTDNTKSVPSVKVSFINESGLYNAIFRSTLPKAKEFQKWVTTQVLPSIRKHGGYHVAQTGLPEDKVHELMDKFNEQLQTIHDELEYEQRLRLNEEEYSASLEEQLELEREAANNATDLNFRAKYSDLTKKAEEVALRKLTTRVFTGHMLEDFFEGAVVRYEEGIKWLKKRKYLNRDMTIPLEHVNNGIFELKIKLLPKKYMARYDVTFGFTSYGYAEVMKEFRREFGSRTIFRCDPIFTDEEECYEEQ